MNLLYILLTILIILIRVCLYTTCFFIASIVGLKLWFEPRKGRCICTTRLEGKVALVTGGNSGIGLETARELARKGARVIIACRDGKKAERAIEDIIRTTGNEKVEYRYLDLSKLSVVRQFAEDYKNQERRLDILVNNAGVAGLKKRPTEDGIDMVMQVNHLAPFLLTNLLLDRLKSSTPSRIVVVSSLLHRFTSFDPYDIAGLKTKSYWDRYAKSKLCNILWARALAMKLPDGVTVNVLHPGVVKTNIFHRMPPMWRKFTLHVIDMLFKTAEEGAQTSIHLCVAPELKWSSGEYYADCKPAATSVDGQNLELAQIVWKESERLTNIE